MGLTVSESFINATEGYRFGDSSEYEAYTDNLGELYKSMQKEYGRCTGKVYIDLKDGRTIPIGWVFIKRMRYEDARDNSPKSWYLREVWVHVHAKPTTVTRTGHYIDVTTGVHVDG